MPVTPTYPGIYIQEVPSGVRTITGVSTSVAAFIDSFKRGPLNKAVQIFSFADFEREFGGLDATSEASYAIQQFFLNGGTQAWVIRVGANPLAAAKAEISSSIGGSAEFVVEAANPGTWGNNLRVKITKTSDMSFTMTVSEYADTTSQVPIRQEVFRNLTRDNARAIVNDPQSGSKLVRVTSANDIPLANGTYSGPHATGEATIPDSPTIGIIIVRQVIDSGTTREVRKTTDLKFPPEIERALPVSLAQIAPVLESAIRSADPELDAAALQLFAGIKVEVVSNQLVVTSGSGSPSDTITFVDNRTERALLLTTAATANVQEYQLGQSSTDPSAHVGGIPGTDGTPPGSTELIGDLNTKSGLYALEDVELFNVLCIPRAAMVSSSDSNALTPSAAQAVMTMATAYCQRRRAFFLMDTPNNIQDPPAIRAWLAANDTLRSDHAAIFYPRVQIPDPLNQFRLRSVGASGTVAGLFARTDEARGVWKAPAGTDASLQNVAAFDYTLTDAENGALNPLAINCLRNFPIYGNICWGARTLDGSDAAASEYKYVPVRRLALFIEESLFRGLKWVVFEPNDEPLWAQIRLNVGAFMNNLFRQGAFQGVMPQQAYEVKCDRTTTTQNDINLGIVNIEVKFAPLKPAEFVVLKIQQLAGQIAT